VKWLVCHEECVPGKATLVLDLPVVASAPVAGVRASAVAVARAQQPENGAWKAQARLAGNMIEVAIRGADLPAGDVLDAFAEQSGIVAAGRPQVVQRAGIPVLVFAKSDAFDKLPEALDLVITRPGVRAIRVHAPFDVPSFAPASPQEGLP
jgi:thiol:disulfide interchange protein DsbD